MRIAIFSTNSKNVYSGGRYHGLMLGECLAARNHAVFYVTNAKPIFYADLSRLPGHNRIELVITKDFKNGIPKGLFDYVVLVPHQDTSSFFYEDVRNFAKISQARLVLINFESANWFNKYSPIKRDEKLWDQWKSCCEDNCLILSSAEESQKYAKKFYTDYPRKTTFAVWNPPINSIVADSISIEKQENRLVAITRLMDQHKGASDLLEMIGHEMSGFTLVLLLGRNAIDESFKQELDDRCAQFNVKYEIKIQLSDKEKFKEIKKASLMLFPSYFEGYGYPPLESLYCGTPCIAYDLPVLREITNNSLHFIEVADALGFKKKIGEVLAQKLDPSTQQTLRLVAKQRAGFDECSDKAVQVFSHRRSKRKFDLTMTLNKGKSVWSEISTIIANARTLHDIKKTANVGISKICKNQETSFCVKGWAYVKKLKLTADIYVNNVLTNSIQVDKHRPDVYTKYDACEREHCGFETDVECGVDRNPTIKIAFRSGDVPLFNLVGANYEFKESQNGFKMEFYEPNSDSKLTDFLRKSCSIENNGHLTTLIQGPENDITSPRPLSDNKKKLSIPKHGTRLVQNPHGNNGLRPHRVPHRKSLTHGPRKSLDLRPWITVRPDLSLDMKKRVACAEDGTSNDANDLRIASLKNRHKGKVGILLGNGPSVRIKDLERLEEFISFGCNRLYLAYDKTKFRPHYLGSTDAQMIRDFGQEMIDHHPGTVFFVAEKKPEFTGDFVWFKMKSTTPFEFSENIYDFVMPGAGTLITAIQIGFHMGITKFILYGVDHSFKFEQNKNAKDEWERVKGEGNHFIKNYRSGKAWAPPIKFQVEGAFLACQCFLQSHGGWIKNATRGGALDILERIEFEEALSLFSQEHTQCDSQFHT